MALVILDWWQDLNVVQTLWVHKPRLLTRHCAGCSGSIMVWDVFTWHGPGLLVYLNILLTSYCYVALLRNCWYTFMDSMYPNDDWLFQKENTMYNQAHHAHNLFEEYSDNFWWMVWTQLSSILCWWIDLSTTVEVYSSTQDTAPTNIRELQTAIEMAWLKISPEVFSPLVESISCCVASLCQVTGVQHNTKWLSACQCIFF